MYRITELCGREKKSYVFDNVTDDVTADTWLPSSSREPLQASFLRTKSAGAVRWRECRSFLGRLSLSTKQGET